MSKELDRKDVKNAAWTWMFFHHCAQNFERMQGLAFCHTMSKPLEKLYGDDPEELKAALTRHMQFFNTEPQLGSVIPGITIALEEARANGGEV
ncbi:MAG: PTS system mannose/fructose/sorbose family transporter subunit IID, partial [Holdemania filiformis]